jgi:hypothetical protein
MSLLKRKATIELTPGHTVTVDAEDVDRIEAAGPWKPTALDQNVVHWYHNRGSNERPAFQLLEHFVMQARDNQSVALIDHSHKGASDLRKANLKVSK